jgi:hypothetical protein
MTTTIDSQATARRRDGALKGLAIHAAVFVLVNLFLLVVDLVTGGAIWFYWATLGWGLGLALHAAVTLVVTRSGHD